MSYGIKSSTFGDSNSVSNDFVSCDNCDKSSEVNTNDFASSDYSVKSSEPKSNDSTSCASTSSDWGKQTFLSRPQPVPTGNQRFPASVPTGRQNRPFPVPTDIRYSPSVTSGWWKSTARHMPHLNRPTSSYFQTYTPYVPQMYYNHMRYGGVRWANAVKPSAGCYWKTHRKGLYWENPYSDAEDEGIFDSGCSRSMTDEAPILWSALAGWEVISTPLGEINALYRSDQSTKHFTTLREILHMVDRQDLLKLYGMVVTYYENHLLAGGWIECYGIRSWRLYTLSNVHVLETVSGEVLYMFADVSYPLSVKLMERMLKHKLEIDKDVVGNDMTTAEQLIRFIKNQIAAAQVSPV
ncbi:hypothetical protein Tco_0451357 [Tanacetum coccineum]